MNIIDIVTIVAAIVFLLIGFISGFGRSLRHFTGGIVGIIISIFVCASFGGMLLGTELVGGWISSLNDYFSSVAEFLGKMQLAVVIFYIVMFIIVQIVRIIVVKFICRIFEADNNVMKVINRVLGVVFVPAVMFMFLLLVFAVLKLFDDTAAIQEMLMKMEGTFLLKLYLNNPIVLHV